MFTGIIEQLGTVAHVREQDTGRRLVLSAGDLGVLPIGSSLAVNGVCLTVVESRGSDVAVDVVPETLSRTNLGGVTRGGSVNLERPMAVDSRFDGHIVQGHVDGIGRVASIDTEEGDVRMTIAPPESLMPYIVEKGSVTVDGVSLTVARVSTVSFQVALIPHTLEVTTLGLLAEGDAVNLETDVLAKYIERLLEARE